MPQDTFVVYKNELETDLDIGQTGVIMIPVKLISIDEDSYTFRKDGQIKPEGTFKEETVQDMRKRVGVVEDTEEPLQKEED